MPSKRLRSGRNVTPVSAGQVYASGTGRYVYGATRKKLEITEPPADELKGFQKPLNQMDPVKETVSDASDTEQESA